MKTFPAVAASMLSVTFAGSAYGTLINVDLQGYRGSEAAPSTYVGTGPGGSGTTFNGITVPNIGSNGAGYSDGSASSTGDQQSVASTNLVDENDAITSITFKASSVGVDNEIANAGNSPYPSIANGGDLFDDYFFDNVGSASSNSTFTISGISAGTVVMLYAYSTSVNGNLSTLSLASGTDAGAAEAFTPTGVYTTTNTDEYTITVDNAGDPITGTIGASQSNPGEIGVLSGLSVSYSPEPGSLALVGCSAIGLLARRRRECGPESSEKVIPLARSGPRRSELSLNWFTFARQRDSK